jgi:hypothetical protein
MERVFLSNEPLKAGSVLSITSGASGDILQATEGLWNLMYQLGFDPNGGTMDRRGVNAAGRYAHFSDLPAEEVEKLSKVLRQMEDYLVKDLLDAHPKDWYVEKIGKFARLGGVDEEEFYKIAGYPHPGNNVISLGERNLLQDSFKGMIVEEPKEVRVAREFKQGRMKTTAQENLDAATKFFGELVEREIHGGGPARSPAMRPAPGARAKKIKCIADAVRP